jgi:catechol 2,3-dioxygenase-like lactoylglutathione lyase family enzyme
MEAWPPSPVALAALTNATYERIASAFAERTANNERVRARLAAFVAALPTPRTAGRPLCSMRVAGQDATAAPSGASTVCAWSGWIFRRPCSASRGDASKTGPRSPVWNLRQLGFASETFDGVWCAAVLLHLTRRDAPDAVAELARVLRPGGLLHLSLKEGVGEAVTGEAIGEVRFFTYYAPAEVRALAEGADLTVEHAEVTEPQADQRQQRWSKFSPETEGGLATVRVNHVNIVVADMERSLAFYVGLLGLRATFEIELEGAWIEEVTGLTGVSARCVFVQPAGGGARFELLEYRRPASERARPADSVPSTIGLRHVAFEVDDWRPSTND